MGAIADLWKSERGLLALALIIAATVLAALGVMTEASWREYTLYIFGAYATSKTVTSAVAIIKGPPADDADPSPTPPTPPTEEKK